MRPARARGLGTAWTTLHLKYEAEVAQLLGMPAGIRAALVPAAVGRRLRLRQSALIPTAYSIGTSFKPAAREPPTDVLHIDNW